MGQESVFQTLFHSRYGRIVQNLIKFPAVFQMNPAVIKITQAFWYLDHGEVEVRTPVKFSVSLNLHFLAVGVYLLFKTQSTFHGN